MLRFDKLTVKAQEALQAAQEMAARPASSRSSRCICSGRWSRRATAWCRRCWKSWGVSRRRWPAKSRSRSSACRKFPACPQQYLSQASNEVLETRVRRSAALKDEYVSTEHILLAISAAEAIPPASCSRAHGASHEAILQAMATIRGSHRVTSQNPESTYRALEQYARDLTELARRGKLDPVIGRDEEIRRVMQILARRTKNNPVLIGEPGVGKTAIVEGLAQRIVAGDVPEVLKPKRLVSLDLAALVAGREISRRIRRPPESGAEGSHRIRRPDHSVH